MIWCPPIWWTLHASKRCAPEGVPKFALTKREQKAEFYRIKQFEAMEKQAVTEGAEPKNLVFADADFWYHASLGLVETHPFEHLHMLVSDLQVMPSVKFDYPAEIELEWNQTVKALARASRCEDLFLQMPLEEQRKALLRLGDVILERYPQSVDFNAVLGKGLTGETVDELADLPTKLASSPLRKMK